MKIFAISISMLVLAGCASRPCVQAPLNLPPVPQELMVRPQSSVPMLDKLFSISDQTSSATKNN